MKHHYTSPAKKHQPGSETPFPQQEGSKTPCPCCTQSHFIVKCPVFANKSPGSRIRIIRNDHRCLNCFHKGHIARKCNYKARCRTCGQRHHTLLHAIQEEQPPQSQVKNKDTERDTSTGGRTKDASVTLSGLSTAHHVLLATALVRLRDSKGHVQSVRAVLDSGSQYSFLTTACARRLGLDLLSFKGRITGLGETRIGGCRGKVKCDAHAEGSERWQMDFTVVDSITGPLPSAPIASHVRRRLSKFKLADPEFWKPAPVDCLIGADFYFKTIIGVPVHIDKDLPMVIPTVFGHVISGPLATISESTQGRSFLVGESVISKALEKFWKLEEPKEVTHVSQEDRLCEQHFLDTHSRTDQGQYVVALPFKTESPSLMDSSSMALKRFLHLEARFKRDEELRKDYHKFIEDYLALGHMKKAVSTAKFVIPHHAVFKGVGPSRKIRVVFDGSASTRNGSLNDKMMVGPKLQSDIRDLLNNFRLHAVAFSADVVKMFRSVHLQESDQCYQHILWRWRPEDTIEEYQLTTVTYGLGPSPFLAMRALQQLVTDEGHQYPLAAQVLVEDVYVDDICTGANSLADAQELKRQLTGLLSKGGFSLSKWSSNDQRLLSQEEASPTGSIELSDDPGVVKILGLTWKSKRDVFCYDIRKPDFVPTKRAVLSAIARIYDPLGFLTPVVFHAKGFLQELWKSQLDWDESMPTHLKSGWQQFLEQLPSLSHCEIPRHIRVAKSSGRQLVGFADASQKGYAAVVYLRVEDHGQTHSYLLKAKSKLAPLKATTINRLEHCGALHLSRLVASLTLLRERLQIKEIHLFCDSKVTLSWIRTPTHLLKTFVANRVAEILELAGEANWSYVRSEENPADYASRGLTPRELPDCEAWWNGPDSLVERMDLWPNHEEVRVEMSELPELKPDTGRALLAYASADHTVNWMEKFSSQNKLLRVIAYAMRFVYGHVMKRPRDSDILMVTAPELERARLFACRATQRSHWARYISGDTLTDSSLLSLSPVLNRELGLFVVGGRLTHSRLDWKTKHPILLPGQSHIAALLVDDLHSRYFHAGPAMLRVLIQHRFWIVGLRRLIRQRLSRCRDCFARTRVPLVPRMGDLPAPRVTPGRAFAHVGIDFAGPWSVRDTLRRKFGVNKAYLCLFVCLATRAVHLELVSNLTSENFLATLSRFIARRGCPSHVYTDCGTTFVGAERQLRTLYKWLHEDQVHGAIETFASKEGIIWKFNPPRAPHMGGIWEAAVKQAKLALARILTDTPFTFEELTTIFSRIEAMLNSRPIAPMNDSLDSLDCLTPGHFLIGTALLAPPEHSLLDDKETRLSRWQLVQQRTQRFWRVWSQDYLITLQKKNKWTEENPDLCVGDMVLLRDDTAAQLKWPIARVTHLHPGHDGRIRVVTVRSAQGTYTRPVAKLVSLRPLLASNPFGVGP